MERAEPAGQVRGRTVRGPAECKDSLVEESTDHDINGLDNRAM